MSALFTEILEANTKAELAGLVCDCYFLFTDFIKELEESGEINYTDYRHKMIRLKEKIAESGSNF